MLISHLYTTYVQFVLPIYYAILPVIKTIIALLFYIYFNIFSLPLASFFHIKFDTQVN